jgi:hypothetical protein
MATTRRRARRKPWKLWAFRVAPRDLDLLHRVAEREDMPCSVFVRRAMREAAARVLQGDVATAAGVDSV